MLRIFLIGCATVDGYPPKLKQGCMDKFSCTKLKNTNKCNKRYNQAMNKWCQNQITPWWRSQLVKGKCKKSCCNRKCFVNRTFMLCLFEIYPTGPPNYVFIFDNLAVAIDCEWGSWNVNDCSSTCGPGTRTKIRTVSIKERHGGKCRGKNVMKEPCIMRNCPSKVLNLFFLDPNILVIGKLSKYLRNLYL